MKGFETGETIVATRAITDRSGINIVRAGARGQVTGWDFQIPDTDCRVVFVEFFNDYGSSDWEVLQDAIIRAPGQDAPRHGPSARRNGVFRDKEIDLRA